jgi:hypothetical protein
MRKFDRLDIVSYTVVLISLTFAIYATINLSSQ